MNSFSEEYLRGVLFTPELVNMTVTLSEYKGKQALYEKQSPETLEKMLEQARVQSVESSNRIEGVDVKHDRVVDIVNRRSAPRNRSEEEVAGYRDALAYIHENYRAIPVSLNTVTLLHELIYKYTGTDGGDFKYEDNLIVDHLKDGTTRTRFTPPPAGQTYIYIHSLVERYRFVSQQRNYPALLLIPLFLLDYLCVHPFTDGNGRTARLWALLLLYHAGFSVGRYVSLERIVEDSRETYYESLERSSKGWHDGKHDVRPWLHYFFGTLIAAYKEFESRVGVFREETSKTEQIKAYVDRTDIPFAISEVEQACPNVSRDMIRLVLRELRDSGLVYVRGKGRGAKWIRKQT